MTHYRIHIRLLALALCCLLLPRTGGAQSVALKTNLLYDATLSPNLGIEARLGRKVTGQLVAGINLWDINADKNRKWRHALVQPEVRYWLCAPFSGHFFGTHLLYTHYTAGNVHLPFGLWSGLRDHRYQGDLVGVGVAYGYSHILNNRWSIEGSVGVGYGVTWYRKYDCATCGSYYGRETRHLFMPTKLSVSVVYYLNRKKQP